MGPTPVYSICCQADVPGQYTWYFVDKRAQPNESIGSSNKQFKRYTLKCRQVEDGFGFYRTGM